MVSSAVRVQTASEHLGMEKARQWLSGVTARVPVLTAQMSCSVTQNPAGRLQHQHGTSLSCRSVFLKPKGKSQLIYFFEGEFPVL